MNVLYYTIQLLKTGRKTLKDNRCFSVKCYKIISKRELDRVDMQIYFYYIRGIKINYTNTVTLAAHTLSVDVIYE